LLFQCVLDGNCGAGNSNRENGKQDTTVAVCVLSTDEEVRAVWCRLSVPGGVNVYKGTNLKKCEALAKPLTKESAAALLTLGRGMVDVTQANDTEEKVSVVFRQGHDHAYS
jgi:hypothetical protein